MARPGKRSHALMMKFSKAVRLGSQLITRMLIQINQQLEGRRIVSRRYCFAVAFVSIISAKIVHLYSHRNSLPPAKFVLWGATFFLQDAALILVARVLAEKDRWRLPRILTVVLATLLSLDVLVMASANISFYIVTGAEIHWRQAKTFHRDAAGLRTLLSGSTGCLLVAAFICTTAWVFTPYIYNGTGELLGVLGSSMRMMFCCRRRARNDSDNYERIASEEEDDKFTDRQEASTSSVESSNETTKERPSMTLLKRLLILIPTLFLVILRCFRPRESAYMYLSCALPLSPFTEGGKPKADAVLVGKLRGGYSWYSNSTALADSPSWDWLSPSEPLPGFTDWSSRDYERVHYNPSEDPLHISNLNNDILEPLREALHNRSVTIKHVIVVNLESTRGDVFPLTQGTFMWDRIAQSHPDGQLSPEALENLANLTLTAEFLTGHATGFEREGDAKKARGGVSATNAFTSGTYTLKSMAGTLCGISPLVADFNREYKYHIYQPCLAHIFNALNRQIIEHTNEEERDDDYTSWPWHSMWMQSVTDGYDNQRLLTTAMGYDDALTKETIMNPDAKHFPPTSKEVNYYGLPDTELRDYLRDAIEDAERDHERLFVTHLTGTTHHPWGLPDDNYLELMGDGLQGDMNKYLNTIGFVDRWLADILQILEDTGVANETLVVMAGDHGLSLPNDGGPTPYDNPHVGSFHIPLLLSHSQLPQVEIDSPVLASQILPSILDLLIESSSLQENSSRVVKDLLPMYEGQSLIRPLIQEVDGQTDWQFTVMNTGGSWLAMRSANKPYRLVVPLITDVEWRFTDLQTDPNEKNALTDFDPADLADAVEIRYGRDASEWIGEAGHVAQWWVSENWSRWKYDKSLDK